MNSKTESEGKKQMKDETKQIKMKLAKATERDSRIR